MSLDERLAVRRRRTGGWPILASVAALVALVAGVTVSRFAADERDTVATARPAPGEGTAIQRPVPGGWSLVVRDPSGLVEPMSRGGGAFALADREDVPTDWLDIVHVRFNPRDQAHWYIELAGSPPFGAALEPGSSVAYGLVLDTTTDGVPDYVVGIESERTAHRAWVTNVATGEVEENRGPRYGYPVEFSYPSAGGPPDGGPPTAIFTFLGDSAPPGLDAAAVRFYAWTSATRDGAVIATDYAPNEGWTMVDPT